MVQERQVDGFARSGHHFLSLPIRWIWMWVAWLVEMHWEVSCGRELRAVLKNQGIAIQNMGIQVTSYTGASVGGGVSLPSCRITNSHYTKGVWMGGDGILWWGHCNML